MSTSPIIWNRKREDTGNSTVGFEIFLFYNQPRKRRTLLHAIVTSTEGPVGWLNQTDVISWIFLPGKTKKKNATD
jgi:hypothetical protein